MNLESQRKLRTVHPKLQKLINEVARYIGVTVLEGCRPDGEYPSHSVEICTTWDEAYTAGFVRGVASQLGLEVDWQDDGYFTLREP